MDNSTPVQEYPSTYFSDIIRQGTAPISVNQLDPEVLNVFNQTIEEAFPDEAEITQHRLYYIAPYILQNINWEKNNAPLQAWQLRYFYQRERFLQKAGLDYTAFLNHGPMQKALESLHLDPVPVFEFILFLKYYYSLRSKLRFSSIELYEQLVEALNESENKTASISMDVTVGGKHYKFSDSQFVRHVIMNSVKDPELKNNFSFSNNFDQGGNRDKLRALDYYIVKTLLDYLPGEKSLNTRGRYSQAERNFGLSVLSLCGRLPDIDREGECSHENNATFDKLMRDFNNHPIPFAMELYLL